MARDSISVITGDGGFWRAEFKPVSAGTLYVDVNVAPPNEVPYRIRGLALATRQHGGDATLNERWVSRPYFNHFAVFTLRTTDGEPAQHVRVEFRRTAGVELRGPGIATGVYSRITDASGYFRMFPYADADTVLPQGNEAVIGDLSVQLGASLGTSVLHDVYVPPSYQYGLTAHLDSYSVGPSLGYFGSVRDSASGALIPGVRLDFERTGGIPISPATFTTFTGSDGVFGFPVVRPLSAGTLEGRFIVRVTPAAAPETLSVQLPTFDADIRTLPPYLVGANGAIRAGASP